MKQKKSYEELTARLQQIIAALEKNDVTLEESMKLFEEGVGLVQQCGSFLAEAQQKVDTLSDSIKKIQDEVE